MQEERVWLTAHGAIGHATRQMSHAGWTAKGPTWMSTAAGDLLDLTTMRPKEMQHLFMLDAVECTRARASEKSQVTRAGLHQ